MEENMSLKENALLSVIELVKDYDKEDSSFHRDFVREFKKEFNIPNKTKEGFAFQNITTPDLIDLFAKIVKNQLVPSEQIWDFLEKTTLINSMKPWEQKRIKQILKFGNYSLD